MKYTHNQKQDFAGLFNFRGCEKPIEVCGNLTYDSNGFTINYSSVLTRLIQEAGRYCESYASELFLDWKQIDKEIEEGTIDTRTALFGFRESGVDHTDFVMSRASESPDLFEYNYRSIWKLEIARIIDHDNYGRPKDKLTMSLYRVSTPTTYSIRAFFEKCRKENQGS